MINLIRWWNVCRLLVPAAPRLPYYELPQLQLFHKGFRRNQIIQLVKSSKCFCRRSQFTSSEKFPQHCHVINVSLWTVFLGSSNSKFPSGFNLTSDLPILKGASLLFLRAAAVTSFFCEHSLSVRKAGLNDGHTMLHCTQTCDVGAR